MNHALLVSTDPEWATRNGLETALARLGFRAIAQSGAQAIAESTRLALVDCEMSDAETVCSFGGISPHAGCLRFAVVSESTSEQVRTSLAGRFHGVLSLPLDECALVRALAAQRYSSISMKERRSLGPKLDELTCGDATVAQHFLRLLVDTNRMTLATLRDAFGASSWAAVASAAHRIAGSMRMLDCAGAIALLVRLEAAAREEDAAFARAILPVVADSLEDLDESLEQLLDTAIPR
jgi:HPt (histidine-containing phosphotransfer) domain-containing protein